MNKPEKYNNTDKDMFFEKAAKVFSSGMVDMIKSQGFCFLENKREGAYVSDTDGISYIDCYTSEATYNLGRRNPKLAACLKKAIHETDQGNFVMLSEEKALLARKISEFIPGPLECVLYGVTRGESMEAACKLARGFTERPELVTVDGGSYGDGGFAISLSARNDKKDFGELIPAVKIVPFGDINAAKASIGSKTAAFILEPVQAENGCREANSEYLRQLRSLCDKSGAKLIFDESQTGFGRTGKKFAFENAGIYPDILVIGEAITGGMFPMTAMVFTKELKNLFDVHPLIHLCTFGGHDIGCRVAMTALDEYEYVKPWENADVMGRRLINDLKGIVSEYKDGKISVSGKGLLISMSFASENSAREFCNQAVKNGVLLKQGKVDGRSVVMRPVLTISETEIDMLLNGVKKALKGME
ncbi:MAG TPA: aminotransferase class III-fold pyridoxal phosphate-dependent enzyme [Desulfomonilia bacterium]